MKKQITRLTRGERPALGIFVRWKSGFFISNFHFSFFKISKRRSTFFRKFSIFVNSTFCATQSRFLATLRDITQLPNTFPTDSDGFSTFQKSISTIFSLVTRCYLSELFEVKRWVSRVVGGLNLMRNIITNVENHRDGPQTHRSFAFWICALWFWAFFFYLHTIFRMGVGSLKPGQGRENRKNVDETLQKHI